MGEHGRANFRFRTVMCARVQSSNRGECPFKEKAQNKTRTKKGMAGEEDEVGEEKRAIQATSHWTCGVHSLGEWIPRL